MVLIKKSGQIINIKDINITLSGIDENEEEKEAEDWQIRMDMMINEN